MAKVDLRPPAYVDEELAWYFGAASAALGVTSSWSAMVWRGLTGWDPSTGGGHNNDTEPPNVKAAGKARRIRATLQGLPGWVLAILEAYYTPRRREGLEDFGALANVMVGTRGARLGFATRSNRQAHTVAEWLAGAHRNTQDAVCAEAVSALRLAWAAYAAARFSKAEVAKINKAIDRVVLGPLARAA